MSKIILKGEYDGANSSKQGITTIKFKFPFSEIVGVIKTFGLIGTDVKLLAKTDSIKFKVGTVRVKTMKVDREGQAQIHFDGGDVDITNLSSLVEKATTLCLTADDGDSNE